MAADPPTGTASGTRGSMLVWPSGHKRSEPRITYVILGPQEMPSAGVGSFFVPSASLVVSLRLQLLLLSLA